MAALGLWATSQNTRGGNPGTTSGQIALYKPGTNFYVSIMNGSTDMVTDENGNLIAKFAYEPFGRINLKATNLDVDGDETDYVGGFWYTGQEYEFESDLYDFKARTYDPQSGRFMQPDPVFTERAGYDSYDPYQYVYNDPVNWSDPSGKVTVKQATHMFNQISRHTMGGFGWAGKSTGMNKIKYNNDIGKLAMAYQLSGMTPEAFALFYTVGKEFGKTETATWFGMNYSGNGNLDPFAAYNNKYSRKMETIRTLVILSLAREELGKQGIHYTMEQAIVFFLFMVPLLSPGPKTWGDSLSMYHDREVPGNQGDTNVKCSYHHRQYAANGNYIRRAMSGLNKRQAFKVPINGMAGGFGLGSLGMAVDSVMRIVPAVAACL
jgi:RHS repeat-associated protein